MFDILFNVHLADPEGGVPPCPWRLPRCRQHSTTSSPPWTEAPMCEPHIPEPPTLQAVARRRTAWAPGVPVVLTVVIFLLIFWRIPFGAFWHALSRAHLLPFLALMG